jgi:cell division protein FtsB
MEMQGGRAVKWMHQGVAKLLQWRRRMASAALLLLAVAALAQFMLGSNGWMAYHKKQAEYRSLQREVEGLKQENGQLDSSIQALRSDPKAIEREAREQLRYAKPGEVIYLMPEPKAAQPAPNETAKR